MQCVAVRCMDCLNSVSVQENSVQIIRCLVISHLENTPMQHNRSCTRELTRKKNCNQSAWKSVQRKTLHQSEKAYISTCGTLKLVQLRKADMIDYHSEANKFQFSGIPFSKVKALQYCCTNLMQVQYKTKFSDKEWTVYNIQLRIATRTISHKH